MSRLDVDKISGKTLQFVWQDSMHETSVRVCLPHLDGIKPSVWGDWGPVYNFSLSNDQVLRFYYDDNHTDVSAKNLTVHSPVLAKDRKVYPFAIRVEDPERGLVLCFFLKHSYEVGKVEVERAKDNVKLFTQSLDESNIQEARAM